VSDLRVLPEEPDEFQPSTSKLAIASFVCGVSAWTVLPIFLNAIAAVILGYMAKKEIDDSGRTITGGSLVFVGLLMGWLQIFIVVFIVGLAASLAIGFPELYHKFVQILNTVRP